MNRVAIVSWATSQFAKDSGRSIFELACDPCITILRSTAVLGRKPDGLLLSSCTSEQYSSAIVSEMLGLQPKVSQRIDNLCNSGTNAVATAYSLIASGLCEMVLVAGAEKATSTGNKLIWDVTRGSFSFPVHWAAVFAKAHMRKYGTTEEQMAMIAVTNRSNAAKNPSALMRTPVTLEQVMTSRKIVEPLKLLDCSAPCDGASAVLLASDRIAREITDNPIWIKGIGQRTSSASFANAMGEDLTTIQSARMAARDAFEMAETSPSRIDVAEVHDAFTILEILAMEDLGFREKGADPSQEIAVRVNPGGGILGRGHPVGATGVAQVAEIAAQLAGKARPSQVKECKQGLIHNLAAAGSSATVLIMGT
ncbi:MAG TPA: thiolase family protein [Nitrososphaera sp.]|nr:thiolase family protein [Nitrososphaera sp.]